MPCILKIGLRFLVMILFFAFRVKGVFRNQKPCFLLGFFNAFGFTPRKMVGNPAITNIIVYQRGRMLSRTRKELKVDDAGIGNQDHLGGGQDDRAVR